VSYAPQSSPGPSRLPACALTALGLSWLIAGPLAAQNAPATAAAATTSAAAPAVPAAEDGPQVDRVKTVKEAPVHATPEGAPVGTLRTGTAARVLGRVDGWTRVQIEGWVRDADVRPDSGTTLTGVTAAEVRAEPDQYVGRTVDWRLQLISVQIADDLRSEMINGQPYLLARGPLPEAGFVYVTLTKAQADQMRALPPLQELVLRVTIRAARTRYLETPLVDLVSVIAGDKAARP